MDRLSTSIPFLAVLVGVRLSLSGLQVNPAGKRGVLKFTDVVKETKKFITYHQSIKLSRAQEKIKKEALSVIPAPCCSNYSIATCCCPCNVAKSVWGLSNFLITEKDYDAAKVKKAVTAWVQYIYPNGYAGDACYQNRCEAAFHKDGCGGMNEQEIVF